MKIYFDTSNGRILAINYDRDDFSWNNTISIPYAVYEVDEIKPDNKSLCKDLTSTYSIVDEANESKYKIVNDAGTWKLDEKPGWQGIYE